VQMQAESPKAAKKRNTFIWRQLATIEGAREFVTMFTFLSEESPQPLPPR